MTNAIYVKLTASDNNYIKYPAYGLLELFEVGSTGSIIAAVFRQAIDGKLGAPVETRNPKFAYSQKVARDGHPLVAELHERQRAGDESRMYPHQVMVQDTGEVLHSCIGRDAAKQFCADHQLRIMQFSSYSPDGRAIAEVLPTIGTKTLAAIYSILCNDEASTDEELIAHFQTFGLTNSEARAQVARRAAALKAPL